MNTKKHRNFIRLPSRIPISFGETNKYNHMGFITNVSSKGMAISSKISYRRRSELDIKINYNNEMIDVKGVVRWIKELQKSITMMMTTYEMGIALKDPPGEYIDLLFDVMDRFEERRNMERYTKVFKILYKSSDELVEEYTQNISYGGMFISTLSPPPLDSIIEIDLMIADIMTVVKMEAQVVRLVTEDDAKSQGLSAGVGVKIMNFIGDGKQIFTDYINSLI